MKKSLIAVLFAIGTTSVESAEIVGDVAAGKARSALCLSCHGPGGNSLNPMWPKLAGQHPDYIKQQLALFKAGKRYDPVMAPMALALDEQAAADLGAYFKSEKRTAGVADPAKAEQGKEIYYAGIPERGVVACGTCHGLEGYGNPGAGFPNIASQHAFYIMKALKDYRAKKRTTDPAGVMQGVTANMTDAEIDQVANFVQGMTP